MTISHIKIKLSLLLFTILSLNILISNTSGFEANNGVVNIVKPQPSVLDDNFNGTLYCNKTDTPTSYYTPATFTKTVSAQTGFNGVDYKVIPTTINYMDDILYYGDSSYLPYTGLNSNTTAGTVYNYSLGVILGFPYYAKIKQIGITGSGNITGGTNVSISLYNTTKIGSDYYKDSLIYKSGNKTFPNSETTMVYDLNVIIDNLNTTDSKFILETNVTEKYKEFNWCNGTTSPDDQSCYIYNNSIFQEISQYFEFYLSISLPFKNDVLFNFPQTGTSVGSYSAFQNFTLTKDIYLKNFTVRGTLWYSGLIFSIWNSRWDIGYNTYIPNNRLYTLGTVYTSGTGFKTLNTALQLEYENTLDGVYFIEVYGSWGWYWDAENDALGSDEAIVYTWDGYSTYYALAGYDLYYSYGYCDPIPLNRIQPYLTINGADYEFNEYAHIVQDDIMTVSVTINERWSYCYVVIVEYISLFKFIEFDTDIDIETYNWLYDKKIANCFGIIDSPNGYAYYEYRFEYPLEYSNVEFFRAHGSTQNLTSMYSGTVVMTTTSTKNIYSFTTYMDINVLDNEFDFIVYNMFETDRNEEFKYNYYNDTQDDNEAYMPVSFSLFYMLMIPLTIAVMAILILIPSKKYQTVTDAVGI